MLSNVEDMTYVLMCFEPLYLPGMGQGPTKQTKILVIQELDRSSVVTREMCKIYRSKIVTSYGKG